MNLQLVTFRPDRAAARRPYRSRHHRPALDLLEDRTVLSSATVQEAVAIVHAHAAARPHHAHAALVSHETTGSAATDRASDAPADLANGPTGTTASDTTHSARKDAKHRTTGTVVHAGSSAKHHRHHVHSTGKGSTSTATPSPTPSPTPPPSPTATPSSSAMAAVSAMTTTSASSSGSDSDPTILTLSLNPIDLNLLGLEVQLYGQNTSSPVTVTVSAQPGSGDLLGNLLTDVAGLVNTQGVGNALDTVLNNVVSLANQAVMSINGQSGSTTYTNTTQVLDAYIAPVNLNLLGAVVTTSPINLVISAHSGTNLALGNIVTDLANLLNNPTGNVVTDIENGLTNLLNELNSQFPNIPSSTPTTSSSSSSPTSSSSGSFQLLSLTVPPIDLNLLGLILQTSTIQVNATSQSGNGNLLGNLINDLLNSVNASQSDLNTINSDLDGVLDKVVGVLNATTLSLPSGALSSLSSTLQELASPTLIDTSGAAVSPEPVLNLDIASTNNTPPVDVNLLGVVVTTSNIQVQLLAQPGQGQILGNLVYNVSHLLDGGLLNVLGILDTLGV